MSDERSDDKTAVSRPPQFRRTPMADGAKEIPSSAKAPPPRWTQGAFPGAAALAQPKASSADPRPLEVWPSHETAPVPSVIDEGSRDLEPTEVGVGARDEHAGAPEEVERTQRIGAPSSVIEAPNEKTERLAAPFVPFGAPRVSATRPDVEPAPPPRAPAQGRIDELIRDVSEAELGVKIALGTVALLTVTVAVLLVVYVFTS